MKACRSFSAATRAVAGRAVSVSNQRFRCGNSFHAPSPITYSTAPNVNNAFPGEQFETPIAPGQVATMVAPFFTDPSVPAALANAISSTPSAANDIAILRFALGLEYLEATFYNINVPRFT